MEKATVNHYEEMMEFKRQAEHSAGRKRQQLLKHYHRMKKEFLKYCKNKGGQSHERQ